MAFCSQDLCWMVEESMTLSERLRAAVVPGGSGRSAGAAGARLRKWRKLVANGDADRFEKRLRWDGLNLETALALLGPVRLKNPAAVPGWATFLDAVVSDTAFDEARAAENIIDRDAPQPFEDLLWRLIPEAARRVRVALGPCQARLSPAATADLARSLLGRLSRVAARTLCAEFDAFRATHAGPAPPGLRDLELRRRRVYRSFVHSLDADKFVAWLLRYPMLARLLATCCQQWIASTVALVRRLDRDADAIRTVFGIRDRRLQIARLAPDLSDPHRDGQTVCRLRFGSGAGLVYKPRPLALDRLFSDLLTVIAHTCNVSVTKRLEVLHRGNYGWMEPVNAAPCTDRTAVERFYRRAGMLTCLVYALGGSDLHAGNLIASGEYPVPVDLECIVGAPLAEPERKNSAEPTNDESPAGSVFRTGMPPVARRNFGDVFRMMGGLADPDPHPRSGHAVAHANTDWMVWRGSGPAVGSEANVPMLAGRLHPASGYVDQVLEGFRSMYEALGRNQVRLRRARLVRQLEREEFRVLIRDTRNYAALLENALLPQHMTSGPDWSIALDVITAPSLASTRRPPGWATRIAERIQLERLDIPLFIGHMDEPTLRTSVGLRLQQRLDRTGHSASKRLALLNADDLEQQLGLLRMSFAIGDAKHRNRERRARAARHPGQEPQRWQALVEVRAIVDLLKRLAVDEGDSVTWHGLGGSSGVGSRLEPVGISLFGGTAGIALFLATAASVTACDTARELAARALAPLCRRLGNRTHRIELAAEIGIGGTVGLGGLVYALARAGRSLGDASYVTVAGAAAHCITRTAVAADTRFDVMSGAAGALLGLLVFHRMTGDDTSLSHALRCGEHLLERRTTDSLTGLRAWRVPRNGIAPGFAHGTSGIACALGRLANATGRDEFRRAAAEAWAVERRHLARRGMERRESRPMTWNPSVNRHGSWCRGTAGIGLARLGALDDSDTEARSEVEATLETMRGAASAEPDGLCCGRMGRADFLFSAGLRFGRQDLCKAAATVGQETVTRALREGRYATGTDEGFRPGLFQGISGIGYELLRMHAPGTVPSVLMWE